MRSISIISEVSTDLEYVCMRQAGCNMWDNERELKERRRVIKKGSLLMI